MTPHKASHPNVIRCVSKLEHRSLFMLQQAEGRTARDDVRDTLKLSKVFVVHSLRHTTLTRLGEARADAFNIMKISGHGSVTDSQRYVHPTPEGMERAFERLHELNPAKFEEAQAEAERIGSKGVPLPAKVPTLQEKRFHKSSQVTEIEKTGP